MTVPGTAEQLFAVEGIGPGQDPARSNVVFRNASTVAVTYTLTVEAEPGSSSALDDPASIERPTSEGLQLAVFRCDPSVFFGETPDSTCTPVLALRPIIFPNAAMDGPDVVGPGGSLAGLLPGSEDYLQLRISLPGDAGDEFQGLTTVLRFIFTSTEA